MKRTALRSLTVKYFFILSSRAKYTVKSSRIRIIYYTGDTRCYHEHGVDQCTPVQSGGKRYKFIQSLYYLHTR